MTEPDRPEPVDPTTDVVVDLGGFSRADLAALDTIARIALAARRAGARTRCTNASAELGDLLELCGLAEAVGLAPEGSAGGGRLGREPEQREEARVEEVRDVGDLPA